MSVNHLTIRWDCLLFQRFPLCCNCPLLRGGSAISSS